MTGFRRADAPKPETHVHIWDAAEAVDKPVMRSERGPYVLYSKYDDSDLWEGPCECSCGQAKYLHAGRIRRTPVGSPASAAAAAKRSPISAEAHRIANVHGTTPEAVQAALDKGWLK